MEGAEAEGRGIRFEFTAAQDLYNQLEKSNLSSADPAYQEDVKKAIAHFTRVTVMITKFAIFSANETLEDINTSDLKYLLTEFYLGELYLKLSGGDRLRIITTAQNYFNGFLDRCITHQVLTKTEKESFERIENPPKDPNELRKEKIDRHNKTKELRAKVEQLTQVLNKAGKSHEEVEEDEETSREITLSLLHLFIENTFDNLSMSKRELEILKMMQQMKEAGEDPSRRPPAEPTKPFKPIVIQNTRDVLRQQVFQPGWRQPTMTLDEYLELERQRGGIIEGGGPQQEIRMEREKERKLQKDSEEDADAETLKAREWDEYKDVNPRGQGNRHNRS